MIARLDDGANNPGFSLFGSGLGTATWNASSAAAMRVLGSAGAAQWYLTQTGIAQLPQLGFLGFAGTGDASGAPDVCLGHSSAGVAEIDNCNLGTYKDLILNNLTVNGTCTGCGGGGGGGAVSSVTGTANQVIATPTTGAVVLTTPQPIAPSSAVTFQSLTAGNTTTAGVIQAVSGPSSTNVFQVTNGAGSPTINWSVDGNGDVSAAGDQVTVGSVTSEVWFGLHPNATCTEAAPGGGYSAIHYKSGGSGDVICLYNVTSAGWVAIDLASVAGGLTSFGGQTGPAITLTTTTNQVLPACAANACSWTLPAADWNELEDVVFGQIQAGVTGTSIGFATNDSGNNYFLVNGKGDVSIGCPAGGTACGTLAIATEPTSGIGGVNITGANALKNSFQTTGGINVASTGGSNGVYEVNGVTVVDSGRNATVVNLTVSGTCTGCASGTVSSITGTANEIIASASTGAVTLSTPQPIGLATNFSANSLSAGCGAAGSTQYVFNSCATGAQVAFQSWRRKFSSSSETAISTGQISTP